VNNTCDKYLKMKTKSRYRKLNCSLIIKF